MSTHFLQSDHWQAFQESLGKTALTDSGADWTYKAYLESGTGNSRLYAPYGPAAYSEAAFAQAHHSLLTQAQHHAATFVRIEPTTGVSTEFLTSLGYKPVTYQRLNPPRTQSIDLNQSADELLAQMKQNTRNVIRNYAKKGITITTSQNPADISHLLRLLKAVSARNSLTTHSEAYYRAQVETLLPRNAATLYLASHEQTVIACALIYTDLSTWYYAHAAADDAYRKLNPGTALLGQVILDAKQRGAKHMDLFGIAPENSADHAWNGFTKFKQSFGGQPISYLGTWEYPLQPVRYRAYTLYHRLRTRI